MNKPHRTLLPTTLAAAVLLALAGTPAAAQDSTGNNATSAAAKAKQLQTVIVTGTRASDRTESSALTPIDVVSAQVLQQTGTTDLPTALARIIPSLNFPRPAAADTADTQRPAQLRGLSPDEVLVLVNGKRWHPGAILLNNGVIGRGSQPVDLNTIPLSAIDHIEVLRDGASAQYGSDAISGVINIILKREPRVATSNCPAASTPRAARRAPPSTRRGSTGSPAASGTPRRRSSSSRTASA